MLTRETCDGRVANRPRAAKYGVTASAISRYCRCCGRAWGIARTHVLWSWRLHSLGRRSVLYPGLQANNPRVISIGSHVTVMTPAILADLTPGQGTCPKIVIGDGCVIHRGFQCNAARSIRIGGHVLIAPNVLIADSDHVVQPGGLPVTKNPKLVTDPVCIGDNCWLCYNSVVLKGVTIGHDCIIGANSVVTHNIPPYSVVVGSPARVVKKVEGSI